jgi:hypothetical protein
MTGRGLCFMLLQEAIANLVAPHLDKCLCNNDLQSIALNFTPRRYIIRMVMPADNAIAEIIQETSFKAINDDDAYVICLLND